MYQLPVPIHRDTSVSQFCPVTKARGSKPDVIRLPSVRTSRGVHVRRTDSVDRTRFASRELSRTGLRPKHLDFVSVLEVDTAVAGALALSSGWTKPLYVQPAVAELADGREVARHPVYGERFWQGNKVVLRSTTVSWQCTLARIAQCAAIALRKKWDPVSRGQYAYSDRRGHDFDIGDLRSSSARIDRGATREGNLNQRIPSFSRPDRTATDRLWIGDEVHAGTGLETIHLELDHR